jgi:hypothetical protein
MKEELVEYLVSKGYHREDAEGINEAYCSGGIAPAVEKFRWADDDTHDYTGELKEVITRWCKND